VSSGLPRVSFTLRGRYVYSAVADWDEEIGRIWRTGGPSFIQFGRDRKRDGNKYAAELLGTPHLAEMLRNHGVDHICEAAGLTANERDAVLLRAAGKSYGEIAQAFTDAGTPIGRGSAQVYAHRGQEKLVYTYTAINGGIALNVA
jgi:hypothetical protein